MMRMLALCLLTLVSCAGEPLQPPVAMPLDDTPAIPATVSKRGVAITIVPPSASLLPGQQQMFRAVVQGPDTFTITWSVRGEGSIQGGLYTAPAKAASSAAGVIAQIEHEGEVIGVVSAIVTFTPAPLKKK